MTLSRTTRSRFLRKLALAIKAEKINFNQEQLLAFTREFAETYDFDIDPLEFVHSFVEKGILHFENDFVRFSLPFIEAYLLAAELKESPDRATKYFNVYASDFDFQAFDLYSEMGPTTGIIDLIFSALDGQAEYLRSARNAPHILLSDQVRPALLGKPERVRALQERIRNAIADVQANKDDKDRKQRMLDVADRARESAAEQSQKSETASGRPPNERTEKLAAALQVWAIGTVLLGAAAEHLEAAPKQRLAKSLIEIATMAIDEWTQINVGVDFEDIKRQLTSDGSIEQFLAKEESTKKDRAEIATMISSVVDVLEYSFVCEPFRRTINHLCEQARLKVLAPSVEKAAVNSEVERVVYSTWLADIDGRRGKQPLKQVIKDLSPAPFLRIVMASHLLTRVYWSQSKEEDRLMLLDAASDILKPLQITMDKPRMKRFVESGNESFASSVDEE